MLTEKEQKAKDVLWEKFERMASYACVDLKHGAISMATREARIALAAQTGCVNLIMKGNARPHQQEDRLCRRYK